MPDARISELPAASAAADTDLTALVQTSGAGLITNKATVAQLRNAVLTGRSAHVRDYGAVGDGTVNDAPAIQAAINDLASKGGGTLLFGTKTYRLASAISISSVAVRLQGQGFAESPSPGNGTWLKIDTTGFTPLTFTGVSARGGGIADIAFFQAHTATQNASWAPTAYDYVIRVQDCLGGVDLHNLYLLAINKGIYCGNSGRLDIHRLRGQVFTTGVEIDDCFDTPRLRNVHFWPFWGGSNFVMQYIQANCDAMLFRRCDGVFIDQAFVFAARSMFRFSGGTNGVTTKFYIGQAYADFCQYGALLEGAGTDGLIDSMTTQGQAFGSSGTPISGAAGIRITAPNCRVQIGNLRCDIVQDNAIRVEQYGNRLDIFALRCVNFNTQANGAAAIHLVDSGTNPANAVYLGSPPLLEGTTGPLQNSSGNGILATGTPPGSAARPGLQIGSTNTGLFLPSGNTLAGAAGGVEVLRATSSGGLTFGGAPNAHALEVATPTGTGNRVLVSGATTGNGVSIQAQGSDANVPLLLADKGSGGVNLSSNGGLTLKLDATGANPVNYVGLRAGTGSTAALIYGAGSATNVDLQLAAQGSGLVRGPTAPTADNSTALATTAWVRLQGIGGAPLANPVFTGSVTLPSWTTAGRPASPTAGMLGWNSDLARFDHFTTSGWKQFTRLDGDSMTGALLVNNAGGGNAVRLAGAATGAAVVLGVDSSSADTNVNVNIGTPKGNGYISTQTADSTAAGGNARGTFANDFQHSRNAATQVASGSTATIGGGNRNTASGGGATVAGGDTGTASGNYSFIGGGESNTASGQDSAVPGGSGNVASGLTSAVGGGQQNAANSTGATVAGGLQNAAGGANAWVPGGSNATTRGISGAGAWAAGTFATPGDAQTRELIARRQSTSATAVVLTTDNAAAGTGNQLVLPNNSTFLVKLLVNARQTGGTAGTAGDSAGWEVTALVKRGANAASTTLIGGGGASLAPTYNDAATAAWRLAVTADTTSGCIGLAGTGEANKNVNWMARLLSAECLG